jgi:hypothetical protein
MTFTPTSLVHSALGAAGYAFGESHEHRALEQMSTAELEALVLLNEHRLRVFKSLSFTGGLGAGMAGTLGFYRMLK